MLLPHPNVQAMPFPRYVVLQIWTLRYANFKCTRLPWRLIKKFQQNFSTCSVHRLIQEHQNYSAEVCICPILALYLWQDLEPSTLLRVTVEIGSFWKTSISTAFSLCSRWRPPLLYLWQSNFCPRYPSSNFTYRRLWRPKFSHIGRGDHNIIGSTPQKLCLYMLYVPFTN